MPLSDLLCACFSDDELESLCTIEDTMHGTEIPQDAALSPFAGQTTASPVVLSAFRIGQ